MSVLLSIKVPFSSVHSLSMAMAGLHLVKKVWGLYVYFSAQESFLVWNVKINGWFRAMVGNPKGP